VIIELFAGPGGWSEGLKALGSTERAAGIDASADACATATAAEHERFCRNVVEQSPGLWAFGSGGVSGIIASPPCKDWSTTGTGDGEHGKTGRLVHEPMRWVRALRPKWTVWECTPAARYAFIRHAAELRDMGYTTSVAVFDAVHYGVPQFRKRVILRARLRELGLIHDPRMTALHVVRDALPNLPAGTVLVSNNGTGGDPKRRGRRTIDQPSFTMTGKCGRFKWEFPDGTRRNVTVAEAAVLQSFRADYPWQGGSVSQQQQVGDAVPPRMATALLGTVAV
jgi:DNA (cytosine-5)-methyltransferase 1